MAPTTASTPNGPKAVAYDAAPSHPVPSDRIVSIEHPCIVRNLGNGIKSLGGEPHMKNLLDRAVGDSEIDKRNFEPEISTRLRPKDPFAKWISADGIPTRDVLVKVTVPKRTGRRRKRGSSGKFTEDPRSSSSTQSSNASNVLERMREAQGDYSVEAVGLINESHRFRTLPDFQTRLTEIPIFQQIRQYYRKPGYDSLHHLPPNTKPGNYGGSFFPPPPSFMQYDVPYLYEYQQPHHIRLGRENATGAVGVVNTHRRHQKRQLPIERDRPTVPTSPMQQISQIVSDRQMLQRAVEALNMLLEERPIITRRFANNRIPGFSGAVFHEALQHVAFGFRNGPFRDVLIKYGVDPRKDPKYRFYQSFMFQIDRHASKAKDKTNWGRTEYYKPSQDPTDHIFEGTKASSNGKVWQACDLMYPVLHKILHTENYRKEFDYTWGWFYNGTFAKVRAIMKDMLLRLSQGTELPHEEYKIIADLPDEVDREFPYQPILPSVHAGTSKSLAKMAADYRVIATSTRYNKHVATGHGRPNTALNDLMGGAEGEDGDQNPEFGSDEDALGDLERLEDFDEGDTRQQQGENEEAAFNGANENTDVDMNYDNEEEDDGEETDWQEADERMEAYDTVEEGKTMVPADEGRAMPPTPRTTH